MNIKLWDWHLTRMKNKMIVFSNKLRSSNDSKVVPKVKDYLFLFSETSIVFCLMELLNST